MPNSAGLGPTAYTPLAPATTGTFKVRVNAAARLVALMPLWHSGQPTFAIASGQVATATPGPVVGEVVKDELGRLFAVFAAPLAAGLYDIAVT